MIRSATAGLTDFLFTIITLLRACIVTTLWTEVNEVDVAIGIVIVDAEEKRIIDVWGAIIYVLESRLEVYKDKENKARK